MKNLQVIAIIKVDINQETETLQHLNILVDKTRKEKGCLQYNLVKDQQEDGTFVMVELWETSESLKLHLLIWQILVLICTKSVENSPFIQEKSYYNSITYKKKRYSNYKVSLFYYFTFLNRLIHLGDVISSKELSI